MTVADDALELLSDPAVWAPLDPLLCLSLPFLPGAAVITTRGGLRLDVVLERVRDLPSTPYRRRLVVLDRDGLERALRTSELRKTRQREFLDKLSTVPTKTLV